MASLASGACPHRPREEVLLKGEAVAAAPRMPVFCHRLFSCGPTCGPSLIPGASRPTATNRGAACRPMTSSATVSVRWCTNWARPGPPCVTCVTCAMDKCTRPRAKRQTRSTFSFAVVSKPPYAPDGGLVPDPYARAGYRQQAAAGSGRRWPCTACGMRDDERRQVLQRVEVNCQILPSSPSKNSKRPAL